MPSIFLRSGDSGPEVAEVRDRLHRLGLLVDGSAQSNFDDELAHAVKVFQQSRGLTVDGVVGPRTFRRLEEARWSIGDRLLTFMPRTMVHGDDVAQLQRRLIELGFIISRVDGIYGHQTERAVRDFQKNVGLSADGICGPDVFRALQRLSRTVAGGSQEHLRELLAWDPNHRARSVETCTIVLDPSDSQNVLHGTSELTEATVCWDIANRLEGRLSAAGALVVMTRSHNSTPSGERARANLANQQNADFVLSIDMDRHANPVAQGVATYYFGHQYSRSATGMRLAELIQEELAARTPLMDLNTHAKTWDLLRLTRMPSVKTTIGYSSNPTDCSQLANAQVRDAVAEGLVASINRILAPRIG
jgi:N-acetylmuramoyl-L-alanine amidase